MMNTLEEEIELALKGEKDVNAKDKHGSTLLYQAAKRGDTEMAKLLIERRADVNAQNNYGRAPLHWAALMGHTDTVKLLIDNQADVNAQNDEEMHPAALGCCLWLPRDYKASFKQPSECER